MQELRSVNGDCCDALERSDFDFEPPSMIEINKKIDLAKKHQAVLMVQLKALIQG